MSKFFLKCIKRLILIAKKNDKGQNFISYFSSCSISHIYGERNMAADCLAKRSVEADLGLCRLSEMPDFVVDRCYHGWHGWSCSSSCNSYWSTDADWYSLFLFCCLGLWPPSHQKKRKKKNDKDKKISYGTHMGIETLVSCSLKAWSWKPKKIPKPNNERPIFFFLSKERKKPRGQ